LIGPPLPEPDPSNSFCARHARLLQASFCRWTGRDLLPPVPADGDGHAEADIGWRLFEAPFALLSHGTGVDPLFTYGNRTALGLFELRWSELLGMPSRLSAEPLNQPERERLLAQVASRGFIEDYAGVRISRTGRRFRIRRATVWTLVDEAGTPCGQAAMFAEWEPLGCP
jgi:hypothetical protein